MPNTTPNALLVSTHDQLRSHSLSTASVTVILGNLRASRCRLDVPTLESLTWDDLADLDIMLSEAIEEAKGLLTAPPTLDPHDYEYYFTPGPRTAEEAEYAFEEEAESFIERQMEVAR
jgi:hypothetical protein